MDNLDHLNSYDYSYSNYDQLPPNPYSYNIKSEPYSQPIVNNIPNNIPQPYLESYAPIYQNTKTVTDPEKLTENQNQPVLNSNVEPNQDQQIQNEKEEEIDTKENIQLLPEHQKRTTKKKGKTSNYWNKKVEDKNFPFYGCTICNISFTTIGEMDEHVTIHKGRITSYDIRVRNQIKRKEKMKQLKNMKKLGKLMKKEKVCVKKEEQTEPDLPFEIKPEDGYIGNEKAPQFNDSINSEVKVDPPSQPKTDDAKVIKTSGNKSKIKEPEDPRLLKLFKCFACQKQFSLSYYLRLHVRSHTDEKPYTCAECGQSFITASKLGRHNKRIHLAIRFQCRICYRFFSRFDILTRHFDKAHPDDKIEGEPYDFNAILPYLKELEEQLKTENELKDGKVKAENSLGDKSVPSCDVKTDLDAKNADGNDVFDTSGAADGYEVDFKSEIVSEHVTVADGAIVKEVKDEGILVEDVKVEVEDQLDGHSDRGDIASDDDYFPSNTWAATPKVDPSSPPPRPKRKTKSSAYPIKCEECDKLISSAAYYKVHLRTHSGERPFKCYICGRGFITSSKMHRHSLTHQEYWEEDDENSLQKIKEENEQKIKEEVCDENNKTDKKKKKTKKGAKSVIKTEHAIRYKKCLKRPHVCIYCNKRFLHLETLQAHKVTHEGQELVLKCNYCLEVMPDEAALSTHEATHTGPRPYLCTICNRTYTKKETMRYHRKTHTAGLSPGEKRPEYICDVCSKSFNAQCKLQRHLVNHRVEKFMLRYECPVCAHMFHTKYHVKMHLTTHQKEGLILEENRNEVLAMVLQNARKIPKKSDSNVSLGEVIPADERSRVCNICGQVFQHFYYLEEHLKSHGSKIAIEDETKTEENKHICPICNKGFKLHYYLKLHSFTHSKERPFICQQCGKGFITKGKLKRHLETHTGLKKFQCHICYKFFTRPSYLRIHIRTIHGSQDYNFSLNKQYSLGNTSV